MCVTWCSRNCVTIIAVSHFLFGFCRRVYISSSPPPPPPPHPHLADFSFYIKQYCWLFFEFSSLSLDCMFVYFEFVTV